MLTDHQLDVHAATMATWASGAALESFDVRTASDALPDASVLQAEIEIGLGLPLSAPPQPDLDLTFNDEGSPWYTLCEVRGRDRPGLLHAVTAAFAVSGVSVHSARIETRADVAIDRFEVSAVDGRKLDEDQKRATIEAIRHGVLAQPRSGRWWWSARRARAQHGRLRNSPGEV